MLKSGRKLTGRGGSDSHHGTPDTPEQKTSHTGERSANYVGSPTTWVFAKTRDARGVVDALTNGRVSISANPYDPRVELRADLDGDGRMDMMMGDNARPTGKPVTFQVRLVGGGVRGGVYHVRVIKNGDPLGTYDTDSASNAVTFADTPAAKGRSYYRVEVEGPQTPYPQVPVSSLLSGKMIALSNPIYFNFDPHF